MKNSLPFLLNRFLNPEEFKSAFLDFLRANNLKVSLDKTIAQIALYDQKTVGALTRQAFFYGSFSADATNLENSYTRPEAEHVVITRVRILDGNSATVDATDWNTGASLVGTKNGQFTINVNGTTVLQNYPGSAADADLTTDDQGFINLAEPILWPGQTTLKLDWEQPAAGAASDNVRFELHGVGLIS